MNQPSEPQAAHIGEQAMQRLVDGELAAGESQALRGHIAACPDCGDRLDAIGRAGDAYLCFHRDALRAQDPAPPRPWEDLRPRLNAMHGSLPRARGGKWRAWLAIAAALVIAVAAYYRMNQPTPVGAADLLRKAAAVQAAPNAARRIRVRSSRRSVVRPAVLPAGPAALGETGVEALFLAAHFSWQDPLSARSFAAWRDQLPKKKDRVRVASNSYEIHTTTQTGPLSEAVLVLDARDLHAMSETLQFTGERVEIDEVIPAAAAPQPPVPPRAESVSLPPAATAAAGPALELRVMAALHAIGADLGEPVQVTRQDSSVLVEASALTPARERQVRDAVAAIPGVTLRVDVPDAAPVKAAPGGRVTTAAGVRVQLEGVLGEEGVNRILDASEAVMARVYALRGLSRRFPQPVEAQLADADRGVLVALRNEHVSGIGTHLRALRAALTPLLPELPPIDVPAPAAWQARSGRVFTAAQQVDHLLNRILAGGEDYARLAPELARALAQLEAEAAAEVRP